MEDGVGDEEDENEKEEVSSLNPFSSGGWCRSLGRLAPKATPKTGLNPFSSGGWCRRKTASRMERFKTSLNPFSSGGWPITGPSRWAKTERRPG